MKNRRCERTRGNLAELDVIYRLDQGSGSIRRPKPIAKHRSRLVIKHFEDRTNGPLLSLTYSAKRSSRFSEERHFVAANWALIAVRPEFSYQFEMGLRAALRESRGNAELM